MMRRVFIAINLPESVKQKLSAYKDKWPELPASWAKPENLHITLEFLGNVSDKELENLKKETREKAGRLKPYTIHLLKIAYGPLNKEPYMIWAVGEKGEHVTLARLKEWEFKRIEPEERPDVNEDIALEIPVNSIEIMESKLKRTGPEYTICESISLA